MPRIRFLPDRRVVEAREAETVLDSALRAGIPHAHACGGNARCSTCRVLVVDGLDACSAPTPQEIEVATMAGLEPPVRLACQTYVHGDVSVRRLVVDDLDENRLDLRTRRAGQPIGKEQEISVLFADIRRFTGFAARELPYDVIDVLDRFAADAVTTVEGRHRGRLTAFLGDGVMAVFGADGEPDPAGRAVKAGLDLVARMDERRQLYLDLYGTELEVNVGIHHGAAVLGDVTWRAGRSLLTAVGDTVNLAQRIEQANKVAGTRVLVSGTVAEMLSGRLVKGRELDTEVPGIEGPLHLTEVVGIG